MKRLILTIIAIFIVLSSLSLIIQKYSKEDKFRIGLVVTLTGTGSEVGIGIRNGLQLKVDEINNSKGINGRDVEIIIKDDKNDPNLIESLTNELIDDGVQIIFGYEISSKMNPMLNSIKGKEIIVLSPTLSTYEMSGINDNFFRTTPTNFNQGTVLGEYANDKNNNTLVIYDYSNEKFAVGVLEGFKYVYDGNVDIYPIENILTEAKDAADYYRKGNFDSVVYIFNPNDVVYISQVFKSSDINTSIYSSNWGLGAGDFENAGSSLENAIFVTMVPGEELSEFEEFKKTYKEKYRKEPGFSSISAYNCAVVLFDSLSKIHAVDYSTLKRLLISADDVEGLITDFEFDETGDAISDLYLVRVINGVIEYID